MLTREEQLAIYGYEMTAEEEADTLRRLQAGEFVVDKFGDVISPGHTAADNPALKFSAPINGHDYGLDDDEPLAFKCAPYAPADLDDGDDEFDDSDEGLENFLHFDPVPSHRADGWTPKKQRAFIMHLSTGACVSAAARHVGMSARSAYMLKARNGAAAFNAAWDRAMEMAVSVIEDNAFDLAINGSIHQKFDAAGNVVHSSRRINTSVMMTILRARKPLVYSPAAQSNAVKVHQAKLDRAECDAARAARTEASKVTEGPSGLLDAEFEEMVRKCQAEQEIIKTALLVGEEPDLSPDNVAQMAESLPRIPFDELNQVGIDTLEAARALKECAAYFPHDLSDDLPDELNDAPLNRHERRRQERYAMRALKRKNRKMSTSYKNSKKGGKAHSLVEKQ